MSPELTWYIARASGLVAWMLTTAAVVWGLALSTRIAGRRPPAAWLADLHRFLGGLALSFTIVHVVTLVVDDWVEFTLADVVLPFASTWRPMAVAWGVVALYVLVAVELTSLLRRRVPSRLWRGVHMASVPLFVVATLHLLTAGTDAGAPWVRTMVALGVLVVVYLTCVRALTPRRRSQHARRRRATMPVTRPRRATRA